MAQTKPNLGAKARKNASALKRLRVSLKEAGVTGGKYGLPKGSLSKKRRQGTTLNDAGKNGLADKLALIKDAFNPFEIKTSTSKHEVLGRRIRGKVGRPTLSKQIGVDNRKKTLLEEFKNRNRTGGVIDRRFGENDANLTPEEKMLERFTREKQKKARGSSIFNLEDDEEEDLTHFGQSLGEMDTFEDPVITDDEDDKGVISQDVVRTSHFGGFEAKRLEDETRVKSKSEVMKEIITKSKHFKHERQKAKEEDENLRMELDEGMDELKSLLNSYASTTTSPVKRQPLAPQSEAFKRLAQKSAKVVAPIPDNDVKGEEFDRYIREMAFAQKAQATDRLKTEEEIALEAKAALEKAERHRLRRMNGEDSDSEEEGDKFGKRRKLNRMAQGDDLDDDFDTETLSNFGLGEGVKVRVIDPNTKVVSEEGSDEGSDEDSEEGSEEGLDEDFEEGSDEDSEEGADEDIYAPDIESSSKSLKSVAKAEKKRDQDSLTNPSELPFTFPIPQSEADFELLVKGRHPLEHETVIKRTRVLNHPKLAPENKDKLEKFMSVLLSYLAQAVADGEFSADLVNVYSTQFTELALQLSEGASRVAIEFIKRAHQQFRDEASISPGQLIIFSLFTRLFSTSDYHHAVITPLQLLLSQSLLQLPLLSTRCLARSLYICGLHYEMQKEAKRFVPEAVDVICTILYLLAPTRTEFEAIPGFFYNSFQLDDSELAEELAKLTQSSYKGVDSVQNLKLSFKDLIQAYVAPTRLDPTYLPTLLVVALRQLLKFAELYATLSSPLSAFPQLFAPVAKALAVFSASPMVSASIKGVLDAHQGRVETLVARCLASRFPLQLQSHRPLAIKSLLPRFDAEYSVDRSSREANKEKANLVKLQRQYKREFRGAVRELRKDSQFLAREKLTLLKQKDAEYQAKIRAITGELANNQGDAAKFNYERKAKKGR
ncbi:nucleolar complex protein 14 [Massospora cicadina]|nr:nucleolar complex protein 14 [Massospora cicadina]